MVADQRMNIERTLYPANRYMVLYSLSVALYAPLSIYSSGVASFLLSDIFLYIVTAILCYAIYVNKFRIQPCYIIFIPIAYVFIFAVLFALDREPILLRTARFLYYLIFISLFAKNFFSIEISLSIYKRIVLFSTFFLFLQFFLYHIFDFYLPGYIPFLNIEREELISYSTHIYTAVNQRMRSIFSEPAHYAAYAAFYLHLNLIMNSLNKVKINDLVICFFITIGIVLSSSTTGIALISLSWSIFFLKKILKGKINLKYIFFTPFILALIFYVLQLDDVQHAFFRLTTNSSNEVRLANRAAIDLSSLSITSLFGHGMDLQGIYLASFERMLFYFGILGTIIFVGTFFILAKKNNYSLWIFLYMIVMGVGTGLWISGNIMLYLSYLISFSFIYRGTNEKFNT